MFLLNKANYITVDIITFSVSRPLFNMCGMSLQFQSFVTAGAKLFIFQDSSFLLGQRGSQFLGNMTTYIFLSSAEKKREESVKEWTVAANRNSLVLRTFYDIKCNNKGI